MTSNGAADRQRNRLTWRGRLSGVLLGAAGGMGVTVLDHRVVAAATLAGAVLSAAVWLRELPPRAPLVRCATRVLLTLALVGAIVAAVGPASWATRATLTATALTVVTVLLVDDVVPSYTLLAGAAVTGFGVALVVGGVAAMTTSSYGLIGALAVVVAAAVLAGGAAILATTGDALFRAAAVGVGAAGVGWGIAALADGDLLLGAAAVGVGVVAVGRVVTHLVRRGGIIAINLRASDPDN